LKDVLEISNNSTVIHCSLFLDQRQHDAEGRVITAEYDKFFFVTACKFTYKINSSTHIWQICNGY